MSFKKLTTETLSKICPELERKLPISAMMLNIIKVALTNSKNCEDEYCTIYGYDGASEITNLFIVAVFLPLNNDKFSIIYTHDTVVTEEMLTAFSKLHDWSNPYMFGAVPESFVSHLEKIVSQKGGKVLKHPCADVYLPLEVSRRLDISKVDLEEDFEVDRLTIENASKVNTHWRYGSIVDHKSISEAIKTLVSAGVFKRTKNPKTGEISSSRTNEDLVSWIVFRQIGTLNALYTADDYRRKGLARWTLEAASKWLAEGGFIPVCEIEEYNKESRSLVDKIGFKLIQNVFWMPYEPSNGNALQE